MRVGTHPSSGYRYRASLRSRIAIWAISLAAAVLMVLLLIWAGAITLPIKPADKPLLTINLPQQMAGSRAKSASAKHASGGTVTPRPSPPQPIVPPIRPTPAPVTPMNLIPISHDDLASLDKTMNTHHEKAGPQLAGGGDDGGSGNGRGNTDDGAGDGPDGHKLYNVDWYTKPTPAQMSTYLRSANAQTGWGEIACRTSDHYHVEDCQELAESPGSGIARAMRQAAWQFLVRPPRIDGTPQIGVWVRIRFDYVIDHEDHDAQ